MDKKATRRMIGVLVVIALVIIVLPLIANNDSPVTMQTAEIKAPPFPEPQNEVSPIPVEMVAEDKSVTQPSANPINPVSAPDVQSSQIHSSSLATIVDTSKSAIIPAAVNNIEPFAGTINKTENAAVRIVTATQQQPEAIQQVVAENSTIPKQVIAKSASDVNPVAKTVPASPKPVNITPQIAATKSATVVAKPQPSAAAAPAVNATANLSSLKKPAWAVQVASFKNQDNAVHLTNRLRAKGYKAFTYKAKHGGLMCVYVGPEFKQVAASALVNQINHDINMRGVIVSYNPLAI